MTGETVLTLGAVGCRFGDRWVLRDLDLSVGSGERIGLRGPNGSGKTSLLRLIAGTLRPAAGSIDILGGAPRSLAARQAVGACLDHERAVYERLTVRQNLEFVAQLRCAGRQARRVVDEVIAELELDEFAEKRTGECSTGMRAQLALGRALIGDPAVLLLDEPTRAMDTAARERTWAALGRRPQVAVLFASHRDDDLQRCDRVLDLERAAAS
ncbi:MAG TPA: ABC transporter ATP-binding protein [Mycobacteriales bacterium]|nr:ABC transporter ATP-binding protein [Mycobacteriales bacterium]